MNWIVQNETRPLYFSEPPNLPGVRLRQEGLLFRVAKEGESVVPADLWARYSWRNIKNDDWVRPTGDYGSQMVMSDYCMMRAHYFLSRGDPKGEGMLARSAEYGWGVKELLNNLGSMAAEKGLFPLAEKLFREAIEIDPHYQTPWRNLEAMRSQAERSIAARPFPAEQMPLPDPMSLLPQGIPAPPQPLIPRGVPGPANSLSE